MSAVYILLHITFLCKWYHDEPTFLNGDMWRKDYDIEYILHDLKHHTGYSPVVKINFFYLVNTFSAGAPD